MKNKIAISITALILLMEITIAYYPSETISFENSFGTEDLVYTIINNVSAVEDFEIEVTTTNIIITFPQDMPPNSFDIVFFKPETKEVVLTVSSGGGGTRTVYKNNTVYKDRDIETIKTEYVDKIVEVPINLTDNMNNIQQPTKNILWLFFIILIIFLCIVTIVIIYNKTRNQEERQWP